MRSLRSLLLLLLPAVLSAQSIRFVHRPPDCNLQTKRWENFFSDNREVHWYAERWKLHLAGAALSGLAGEGLHQVTGRKLPRWAAYAIANSAVALVPHIRQVALEPAGQRTINPRDWAFDAHVRTIPLQLVLVFGSNAGWKTKAASVAAMSGAYATLQCYGSP